MSVIAAAEIHACACVLVAFYWCITQSWYCHFALHYHNFMLTFCLWNICLVVVSHIIAWCLIDLWKFGSFCKLDTQKFSNVHMHIFTVSAASYHWQLNWVLNFIVLFCCASCALVIAHVVFPKCSSRWLWRLKISASDVPLLDTGKCV